MQEAVPAWTHVSPRTSHNIATLEASNRVDHLQAPQDLSTELEILREIVTGRRKRALKSIRVEFVLPNYSDEQCGRYESPRTQRMNSHAFSEALMALFETLRTWEEDGVGGGIVLTLGAIYSPMDRYHRRYRERLTHELDVVMERRHDMFEERYEGSFITLLSPERLPTLSRVSAFMVDPFSTKSKRRLANSTVAYIASRLPTRQEISWDLNDSEKDDWFTDTRGKHRDSFAAGLKGNSFSSIRKAKIVMSGEKPSYQLDTPQCLIRSGRSFDSLSTALRGFSQTLTSLTLSATVEHSLFWPAIEDDTVNVKPFWPALKSFFLRFDPSTPCGDRYFIAFVPSLSQWLEGREVRCMIKPNEIITLLSSFAKAAQRMPRLDRAVLECPLKAMFGFEEHRFEVHYGAPGSPVLDGDETTEDICVRRLYYEVGKWRPDGELLQELRNIGREQHGAKVIQRFLGRRRNFPGIVITQESSIYDK